MKKFFAVILVLVLCIGVAGCGEGTKTPAEPTPVPTATPIPYADTDFIAAMKNSLQARWDVSNQKSNADLLAMDSTEYTNFMKSCIGAELEIIDAYPDKNYADAKLQNLAKKYVNSLNDQLAALEYYAADLMQYNEKWTAAYDERTKLILELVDEYGLTVDEQYQHILDELSTNAQVVTKKEEKENAIEALSDQVNFQLVENEEDYGWHEYETVIENTTDEIIAYYSLEISLLDADGVIIGTTYTDPINNWKPGTKAKLKFTTDEEFSSIEWTADYYVE